MTFKFCYTCYSKHKKKKKVLEITDRWRCTNGHMLKKNISNHFFECSKRSRYKALIYARNAAQYDFFFEDVKSAACRQLVQLQISSKVSY